MYFVMWTQWRLRSACTAMQSDLSSLSAWGGGWVRQRCFVSCVTRASNWYWLTVRQGLLSLQLVRVEGECFYFFCFFTFIFLFLPCPSLSSLLSRSSVSLLPFSGRQHKMTHKCWLAIIHQHNQSVCQLEETWLRCAVWSESLLGTYEGSSISS